MLIKFYKVLSYLLLPVAAFLAFVAVFGLLLALGNLSALLSVFLSGCTALYLFLSFSFVLRVLIQHGHCPARRYDWIKVNAYVAGVFGMLMLMQGIAFMYNQEVQQMLLKEMEQLPQAKEIGVDMMRRSLRGVLVVFILLGSLLFLHVMITLRQIRIFRGAFVDHS